MDICWDLWGSSLLPLVTTPSPAYLSPQQASKASYNIPESVRGQHQECEAVTSTCQGALKSPEVLQITAHHRAVQAQQNLAYSWLPPQPGGLKAEGSHNSYISIHKYIFTTYLGNILMVPWTLRLLMIPEAESWISGGLFEMNTLAVIRVTIWVGGAE